MVVVYDFGRALHSAVNGGVESYVHRIGRTGRAVTFYTDEDCGAKALIALLKDGGYPYPKELETCASQERDDIQNKNWYKNQKKNSRSGGKGFGGGKGKDGGGKGKGKGKGKDGGKGKGKGKGK